MKLYELIHKEECISYPENLDLDVDFITSDIYKIKDRCIFLAYKHLNFDIEGALHLLQNYKSSVIICEKELKIPEGVKNIVTVENVRKISALIYKRFYNIDFSKLKIIGITGTNGKSSTAAMLEHILLYDSRKVGFIGTGKIKICGSVITDNTYSMTTPDVDLLYSSIKQMENAGCEVVVMEVSSHSLYFDKVSAIPFEISVFTNLSSEHLDFHKSIDEYFKSKLKLLSLSKKMIFNMDDYYSKGAYHAYEGEKYGIGIIQDGDVMARDINLSSISESDYVYREQNRLFHVYLNLGGAYNIYNSLFAIKCAALLGLDTRIIKDALKSLFKIEGRNEIVSFYPTVIIDYAHTPDAMLNELKHIKKYLKSGQKLITLFGCGGNRDRKKRAEMAKIANMYSDLVIVTSDNSRNESRTQIFKDILSGFTDTAKRKVITSRESAITQTIIKSGDNDVILIIGKGHEKYNIDKDGVHFFDEKKIISDAIIKRNRVRNNENKAMLSSITK